MSCSKCKQKNNQIPTKEELVKITDNVTKISVVLMVLFLGLSLYGLYSIISLFI